MLYNSVVLLLYIEGEWSVRHRMFLLFEVYLAKHRAYYGEKGVGGDNERLFKFGSGSALVVKLALWGRYQKISGADGSI